MRKITTAVTSAALAFSMLALAVPAAAVTGYDSQYNSESAFVNVSPGQTQNFQVFFINAGTTTWTRGTGTQVDLAACLEDKVTCNAQDATEAGWNTNWLSSTRYATTSNTSVAPGGVGTVSYNVTAPPGGFERSDVHVRRPGSPGLQRNLGPGQHRHDHVERAGLQDRRAQRRGVEHHDEQRDERCHG